MRLFRCTVAEYICTQRRGEQRGVVVADFSWFHLCAAAGGTLPLWIYLLCAPWRLPWYSLFGLLAGELLLVFVTAPFTDLLVTLFTVRGTNVCVRCGAPMQFAGRRFNPHGHRKPCASDIAIFVGFIAANILIWSGLLRLEFC